MGMVAQSHRIFAGITKYFIILGKIFNVDIGLGSFKNHNIIILTLNGFQNYLSYLILTCSYVKLFDKINIIIIKENYHNRAKYCTVNLFRHCKRNKILRF